MIAPEIPLRILYVEGKVHEEDLAVSAPFVAEIVSVPEKGLEYARGCYATTGRVFASYSCRRRSDTVREWERLTGERLTPTLEPVASERRAK